MVPPKIKVLARWNLKSQPHWNQGPNADFRGVRIQPIRAQLCHPEAIFPWTWAKDSGCTQTPLKSRGLMQQELQNWAPAIPNQSPKAIVTQNKPPVFPRTPLSKYQPTSVCAPTYASGLQAKDALDIKMVREGWTKCVWSPGNLVFPRSEGLCFQRTGTSCLPCGFAKQAP